MENSTLDLTVSPDGKYKVVEYGLPSNDPTRNEYNGFVVLESTQPAHLANKAILDLQDAAARKFVISFAAANGLGNAGVSGLPTPYACDEQDKLITDPKTQRVAKYRMRVSVSRGLR